MLSPLNSPIRLLALGLVAVVAGCASGPEPQRSVTAGDPVAEGERTAEGAPVAVIEVPEAARLSFERAVAAMRRGDVTEAELELEQLTLEYPDFAGPRVNLGILYMNSGRDEAAQEALELALALNPTHTGAYNQLGILMRRQGKFAEAEQAYADALSVNPDYALAHYNLGVLLDLYMKRPEEALAHYERYQSLAGEDDQVRKWIVDLRRRLGIKAPTTRVAQEVAQEVGQEDSP